MNWSRALSICAPGSVLPWRHWRCQRYATRSGMALSVDRGSPAIVDKPWPGSESWGVAPRQKVKYYDDPVRLGRRLRETREAAGMSQRELSFPGCTAAYISRIRSEEHTSELQSRVDLV